MLLLNNFLEEDSYTEKHNKSSAQSLVYLASFGLWIHAVTVWINVQAATSQQYAKGIKIRIRRNAWDKNESYSL